MTTVTLDRPFAYSTSTWQEDGCHKNISKLVRFAPVDPESDLLTAVNVEQRTFSDRHEYLVTSLDNSPHLTFALPGD